MRAATFLLLGMLSTAVAWAGDILKADDPIPDQYIVILKESSTIPPGLAVAADRRQAIRQLADDLTHQAGGRRGWVFSEAVSGFSIQIDRRGAQRLGRHPQVAFIAEDSWVETTEIDYQFDPPSWGLDRLDQRHGDLDNLYSWYAPDSARGVHVYVMDSGIRSSHRDFEGRVDTVESFSTVDDENGTEDCHGHGTHVTGIIGGLDHGVSKDVWLHSVRVLDCTGRGPVSSVIAGVDWITNRVMESPHPAVANLSIGSRGSLILDNAIKASIAAGVVYVAAAGNSADDACEYSPARIPEVITVGAIDADGSRSSFSNHGECVDIYAPGRGITSTFNRTDADTLTMSGTSMAAPHVAGIAVNLLAQKPLTSPEEIKQQILAHAVRFEEPFEQGDVGKLAFSLIDISQDPVIFADNWE